MSAKESLPEHDAAWIKNYRGEVLKSYTADFGGALLHGQLVRCALGRRLSHRQRTLRRSLGNAVGPQTLAVCRPSRGCGCCTPVAR